MLSKMFQVLNTWVMSSRMTWRPLILFTYRQAFTKRQVSISLQIYAFIYPKELTACGRSRLVQSMAHSRHEKIDTTAFWKFWKVDMHEKMCQDETVVEKAGK